MPSRRALSVALLLALPTSAFGAPPAPQAPPSPRGPSIEAPAPWPPPPPPQPVDPARAAAEMNAAGALAASRLHVAAGLAYGRIVENPSHPAHAAAVAALAQNARHMNEAAAGERFFGAVAPGTIAAISDPSTRASAALLFARYRLAAGRWPEVPAVLPLIDDRDPSKPRALLLAAAAHVRMGKSVPALQALYEATKLLDAAAPSYERVMLRDLALVSIGRIYYSASMRLDESDLLTIDSAKIDGTKLSAAAKYYEKIDMASPLFGEAAHELAWVYWVAGDSSRALGLAQRISSSASSSQHAAEADLLRAAIHVSSCDYPSGRAATAAARTRAVPLHKLLTTAIAAADAGRRPDGYLVLLAAARDRNPSLDPTLATEIARTSTDYTVARRLGHLARVDADLRALATTSMKSALDAERARVAAAIAADVRRRLVLLRDDLGLFADHANFIDGVAASSAASQPARDVAAVPPVRPGPVELGEPRMPYSHPRYRSQLFHTMVISRCGG